MIRRPLLTLCIALLLAALAAVAVARLRIDTSLTSLFDADDPAATALDRVMNHYKAVEELIVLVEDPQPGAPSPQRLLAFAGRLDAAVAADPEASRLSAGVIYQPDDQTRAFFEKVLVPSGLFYLDDAGFDAARQRLTRAGMAEQLRRNETLIATPGPAADALSKVLLKDPLRLHEFVLDRLGDAVPMKGGGGGGGGGAFLSPDGGALLVRVRGRRPVSDIDFSRQFTAAVTRLARRENADGLRVDFAGGYAIAAASERAIRGDMIGTVIGSCVCLQLLFALAYRAPVRSFLLAFLPVVLGVVYGFGAYALLARALSPMTAVIGGILAGMAIDYAIDFLAGYQARRAEGMLAAEAASAARRYVGSPLLAAWATSVIGFATIGVSGVKALRDFSLLGSLGLTGAFACALVLLPALLVLVDRGGGGRPPVARQRLPVAALLDLLRRRGRLAIGAVAAVALGAAVVVLLPGPALPLETDLTVMHPRPNPPLETQERIAQRFGLSPDTMVVHLRAPGETDLLRLAHAADARLRHADVRAAGIRGTFGLATLLPDPAAAPARVAATSAAYAERVVTDFRAAVADSIFDPAAFAPYEGFLKTLLTAPRPPDLATLRQYPSLADMILPSVAPEGSGPAPGPGGQQVTAPASSPGTQPHAAAGAAGAAHRSATPQAADRGGAGADGGASARAGAGAGAGAGADAITLVFLRDPLARREARDAAVAAVRAALGDLPGATLTGISVLNHDAETTVRRDLPRLVLISVGLVVLYLLLHFRNAVDGLLAVLPALFGLACVVAFMRLTGQKLNMVNLIAFPLLIGIDVDYGVFVVAAARRRESRGLPASQMIARLAPATGAVILCAATTFLGFGSLAFTSVPAARSLGSSVAVGVASCLAATLFFVVPVLLWTSRDRAGEVG